MYLEVRVDPFYHFRHHDRHLYSGWRCIDHFTGRSVGNIVLNTSVIARISFPAPNSFNQFPMNLPDQSFRDRVTTVIRALLPISRTQSSESRAASRKPRARSICVMAAVMRLVMVNFGLKAIICHTSSSPVVCPPLELSTFYDGCLLLHNPICGLSA